MKKQFSYLPYVGIDEYAYLGCIAADEPMAAEVADRLGARGFRFICDSCGGKFAQSPAAVAEAIAHCGGAVVFLSEKSMETLAFRNEINYLLSLRKPLICVKLGEYTLGHGLDMQLVNIKTISYTDPEETAEALVESGILTQEMMGEGMKKRDFNRKRLYIIAAMVAAAVLIFSLCVNAVIQKRISPAFVLQDVDGSEYVNISRYGDEGIAAMAGKSVRELDLSGGEFTSLMAMKDLCAEIVNASDIAADIPLWPLGQVQGLKTVKVDQQQLIYARDLCDAGITVVVVH